MPSFCFVPGFSEVGVISHLLKESHSCPPPGRRHSIGTSNGSLLARSQVTASPGGILRFYLGIWIYYNKFLEFYFYNVRYIFLYEFLGILSYCLREKCFVDGRHISYGNHIIKDGWFIDHAPRGRGGGRGKVQLDFVYLYVVFIFCSFAFFCRFWIVFFLRTNDIFTWIFPGAGDFQQCFVLHIAHFRNLDSFHNFLNFDMSQTAKGDKSERCIWGKCKWSLRQHENKVGQICIYLSNAL